MTLNEKIQLREWNKLRYHDPVDILRRLRDIEPIVTVSDLRPEVKSLRRGDLKRYREGRDAALFCHGMSRVLGTKVFFSLVEAADYDFVSLGRLGRRSSI
jgi:hypothetical protein